MFDGFEEFDLATTGTLIHGRRGGSGPPVLLLHGIPETHLMWHRVAPRLAERFTVVATDLRGYGDSGTPPSAPDHAPYSMRELARDQIEVMAALGFERFAAVGHDRGARCAYRLALDHPTAVSRLAVLDIVPTGDAFARADREFSLGYWVWSFLAAPEPVPERLIAEAPDVLVDHMLDSWSDVPDAFSGRGPSRVRRPVPRSRQGARDLRGVPRGRDPGLPARRGRPREAADRLPGTGAVEWQRGRRQLVPTAGDLAGVGG